MTEKKQSDHSASFDYFDSIYRNTRINAMLLMNEHGRINRVNQAFTDSFGYTTADLGGKNFSILFIAEDIARQRPQNELKKVLATGQADDQNYLLKKDQQPVWVSGETVRVQISDAEPVLIKIIQNISQQKQAEEGMMYAVHFNESILSTIDEIVIVLNKNMEVIKANPAFYTLFRRTDPAMALENFPEFITKYDKSGQLTKKLNQLANSQEAFYDLEISIESSSGDRSFNVSGKIMPTKKNEDNLLLVVHEITVHKQIEREREDIIGFVAHELRNPLSNIILCNEMLKHSTAGDQLQTKELLQRSQNNVFRLNRMISELYEATRINSGNFILDVAEFDFDLMIREAVQTVVVLQPAYRVTAKGTAGIIKGDMHRLMQVVINYLSNGIKYSNGNKDIYIDVLRETGMVTVCVKDNGLGIAQQQLPFVFQRFFRAEKSRNLEGIGLGLFLCRRIIDAHNGKVWAESKEGEGSSFYFSIPVL